MPSVYWVFSLVVYSFTILIKLPVPFLLYDTSGILHGIDIYPLTISKIASTNSVRNKASPSDNDWLKLLRYDWFENLSDKFILKQIVKITVQVRKIMVRSDWFRKFMVRVWLVSKLSSTDQDMNGWIPPKYQHSSVTFPNNTGFTPLPTKNV